MENTRVSWTAQAVARSRALHMLIDDKPWVYEDRVAADLINLENQIADGLDPQSYAALGPSSSRAVFLVRERYCEEVLDREIADGASQYVVLGAGLNGFAYNATPLSQKVTVFEVDLPHTQSWKRERLAECQIRIPKSVRFVPIDFETQSVKKTLIEAGFDRMEPAVFAWNGVTQYLTDNTISDTLSELRSLAASGSVVVVQICLPKSAIGFEDRQELDRVMQLATEHGEEWINGHTADDFRSLFYEEGFVEVEILNSFDADIKYLSGRKDFLRTPAYFAMVRATMP